MELQCGDRVAVYLMWSGAPVRYGATIMAAESKSEEILVAFDEEFIGAPPRMLVHVKQCRKLKKREKRRIFIPQGALDAMENKGTDHTKGWTIYRGNLVREHATLV